MFHITKFIIFVSLFGFFITVSIVNKSTSSDDYHPVRRLSDNCHWDIRQASTVCTRKDGTIWVGPAGDKMEKREKSPVAFEKKETYSKPTPKAKDSSKNKKPIWQTGSKHSKKLNLGPPIECAKNPLPSIAPAGGESGFKKGNAVAQNVILMIVDDLQPDAISSFNVRPRPSSERLAYQFMRTPNLSKLANDGALFSRAYTPHPLCSPSRYAILSGRYASRSRRAVERSISRERDRNPSLAHLTLNGNAWVVEGTVTVAQAFQQAGFKTAMSGKWHLSSTVETESTGFTYQDAQKSSAPYDIEKKEVKLAGFDDVFALYPLNMRDSGFDWFSHNPEWMAVTSFDWWDKTEGNKFLYFAYTLPHTPNSGAALQHEADRIPDVKGGLTPSEKKRMIEMRDRSRHHIMKGRAVATHNAMGRPWQEGNDMMHNIPGLLWIDSIVGEFIDHLEKRNELDNTLLIFGADHGNIAKGHCFEPAMRVPLLLHCPNLISKGVVVDAVVANIDLASTMLDAIGVGDQFLRRNNRVIDSRSMMPLIAPKHVRFNPKKEIHEDGIYCEIYSDRSIVAANYTLIDLSRTISKEAPYGRKPWDDRIQLYKSSDVEQKNNLMTKVMKHEDPFAAHQLNILTSHLAAHIRDTVPKCQTEFWPNGFPTKLTKSRPHKSS